MKLVGWLMVLIAAGAGCVGDGAVGDGAENPTPMPGPTLVNVGAEPPGAHCANGGVAVSWGVDDNANGVLDPSEVDDTEYRCSPAPAPAPRVLVRTATEPRGPNCEHGGTVVRSGIDANFNGSLDDDEATETAYVCESPDAPPAVLSRVAKIGPGAACAFGGTALYSGRDVNKNDALDEAEIESEAFVCDDATASVEVEVGAGDRHTCARKANGTVWCWGDNLLHQLGISSFNNVPGAVPIVGVVGATALGVGGDHACAVVDGGAVWCWGDNSSGQLGDTDRFTSAARRVMGVPAMTEVAGGGGHTCGLTVDGAVWCWGSDFDGESGQGATASRVAPAPVPGLTDIVAIAAGASHTCALQRDGAVVCWGAQIGGAVDSEVCGFDFACHRTPTVVDGLPRAETIASSAAHACVITTDHQAWCWGYNFDGPLGDGTDVNRPTPAPVVGLDDVREIAAGGNHSCAVRGDNSVWCWGSNAFGQLATGGVGVPRRLPNHAVGNLGIAGLSLGTWHSCALRDGAPVCWGHNSSGEVGPVGRPNPTEVLINVEDFSAGNHGACAVLTGGSVWCWGAFAFGEQLGIWTVTPTPMFGLPAAKSVAAGATHACILAVDRSVWCWGGNTYGELGDPLIGDQITPVRVPVIDDAVAIYAGGFQSCAQRANGSLWCWGSDGVLFGNGRPPTQMLPTVTSVALGDLHGCAVDTSHVSWCWGNNESNQISPSFRDVLPITQELTDVVAVTASFDGSCAEQSDGRLWCWGSFHAERTLTPIGDFAAIDAGYFHTCMLRPDSTAACFGFNAYGQLGDGTFDFHTNPVAVTGLSDLVQLSAGYQQTCAVRRDKSLWCWGANDAGEIGDGGLTERVTRFTAVEL
jgi:alpha-tubulin suppressor-like RCC1 family protein